MIQQHNEFTHTDTMVIQSYRRRQLQQYHYKTNVTLAI